MAGRATRRRWAGLLALACAAGCGSAASDSFCQLGQEHEVARTSAKDFDAISLVAHGGGAVALWSTTGGLFARALDAGGGGSGPALRLGVRCEGGFDALASDGALAVACLLRPARGKHEHQPGGVMVHELDRQLRITRTRVVGEAGAQSEGVALAPGRGGLELAWHDGSPDAHRVFWASLAPGASAPVVVSERGRIAQAPTLTPADGTTVLAWAENWVERGKLASRLAVWDRRSRPRTLLARAHVAAMPQWLALGDGLALGYRDRGAREARTGLYLAPAGRRGERLGRAVRVGRADGVGRPVLRACMDGVVAATPRTYGGDYFVGINWLDRSLSRARGEQQFYEDSHAFTQVSAACLDTHALLLIAEFPQLQRDSTALRSVPYRCR